MLSRYAEFEKLGQGGMGVVYRATDTQLHRKVALKFVTARFGREDWARARFLREARTAAALNHPSICTIFEIGEVGPGEGDRFVPPIAAGTPFLAMEWIDGRSLEVFAHEHGRLRVDDLLGMAAPIAEGLAAAHAKGIIHRDLKPGNVMVTVEGRPKILDFGLAKRIAGADENATTETGGETDSGELTRLGQVLGTVAYMSPEQAQAKAVDARSDLFSFGVMLYELAAGTRPFRGETPTSTIAKILESEPTPLGDIRDDLPGELLRIVRRCLRKRPEERFQTARDLVVALTELRQELTSGPARGWSGAARAPRPGRRLGLVIGLASALLVTGALAGAILWRSSHRPAPSPEPSLKQITSNPPESEILDAAISPDGKYVAYTDPTGISLRIVETGETRRIVPHETLGAMTLAWFPDGLRLAVTATDGGQPSAWVVSILGGAPRRLREHAAVGSVSPDESLISFLDISGGVGATTTGLWVMGSDGSGARRIVPKESGGFFSAGRWSDDGRKLLYTRYIPDGGRRSLEVWDRDSGATLVLLSDPRIPMTGYSAYAWAPGGRILYGLLTDPSQSEEVSNLWEGRTDPRSGAIIGTPRMLTAFPDSMVRAISATRDGKRLAFLRQRRQWDIFLGELRADGNRLEGVRRFTLDERNDQGSAWTRDSRALFFSSDRQGTSDIFRQGVEDRVPEAVVQGPGIETAGVLSPDGTWLLYSSLAQPPEVPSNRILRVPIAGGPPETVVESKDVVWCLCSRTAAASCLLGERHGFTLKFFALDPVRGKGREIGERSASASDLSPDGSRLAIAAASDGKSGKFGLTILSVADGTSRPLNTDHLNSVMDVAWSGDGRSLFVVDVSLTSSRLLHVDLEGRISVLHESSAFPPRLLGGSFPSPDGKLLAFDEQTSERNAWIMDNY